MTLAIRLDLVQGTNQIYDLWLTRPVLDEETEEPVLDGSGQPTYEPLPLPEGTDLWWYVFRQAGDVDDDAVIRKTTEDGITIDPDQETAGVGHAIVTLAPGDSAGAVPAMDYWECQARIDGELSRVAWGRIRIIQRLIQATELGD